MNSTAFVTVAPGVTRYDVFDDYVLRGTQEDLMRSGFAEPSWFPDGTQRDRSGRIVRTGRGVLNGRKVRCTKDRDDPDRFEIRVICPAEECRRNEERKALVAAEADERITLARLPQSHADYRAKIVRFVETMEDELLALTDPHAGGLDEPHMQPIRDAYRELRGGYQYSPAALDAIADAFGRLQSVIATGETLYSPSERRALVAAIKTKTTAANAPLQAFLDRVKSRASKRSS